MKILLLRTWSFGSLYFFLATEFVHVFQQKEKKKENTFTGTPFKCVASRIYRLLASGDPGKQGKQGNPSETQKFRSLACGAPPSLVVNG